MEDNVLNVNRWGKTNMKMKWYIRGCYGRRVVKGANEEKERHDYRMV
jgi:hypothetical protein